MAQSNPNKQWRKTALPETESEAWLRRQLAGLGK
jgi:hypothetical protein